jgi:hypothetical protein
MLGLAYEQEPSARDSLWIPEGTALVYESADALVYYAIHPVNWS